MISIVTQETDNLSSSFDNWNTQILKIFNDFKISPEVNQYLNYNPQINGVSIKGKDRNFNLIFNGKKQFN